MTSTSAPLSVAELHALNANWRAANYLSVGQIYLLDNPLLREPLSLEHIKPRLLGHWGTTPGLNFVYAHMNRVIRTREVNAIFVTGPGHGGPGLIANTYLEGTYTEVYPHIGRDEEGLRRLFRQFSFPGGIPSHVAPETPGSIHEGGELSYFLLHAYGAAFDNPDLLFCCVVGDGEAEAGPLAASWHSNKFLDPAQDGAVLPILHLNGYKIANPTILARIPHAELRSLLEGYGYAPRFVEGTDPEKMHQLMAATLEEVANEIAEIQRRAREDGRSERPRWPMIVLRTPKGWTGPKIVDGLPAEGSIEEAIAHCTHGIGIWEWASSDAGVEPDVVLACAGDIPTLETLAAAAILRERLPELKVRVVNVVDLMRLEPDSEHPHGLSDSDFDELFTIGQPVIFAYHGYPWLIHRLTYRRANHPNIHVRGYKEEGTTTTPFDMVMR